MNLLILPVGILVWLIGGHSHFITFCVDLVTGAANEDDDEGLLNYIHNLPG